MMAPKMREPIPARPFQQFIEDRIRAYAGNHAVHGVCEELGWDRKPDGDLAHDGGEKKLYRYRYGVSETAFGKKKGVSRGTRVVRIRDEYERADVEDALHHAGVLFEDVYPPRLYPALYHDIPLEPEEWCPSCAARCTPIRSVCPWCEWSFHERLRLAA